MFELMFVKNVHFINSKEFNKKNNVFIKNAKLFANYSLDYTIDN